MNLTAVADFWDKINAYKQICPEQIVIATFFALGGFTLEAQRFCTEQAIGMAEQIVYLWAEE